MKYNEMKQAVKLLRFRKKRSIDTCPFLDKVGYALPVLVVSS